MFSDVQVDVRSGLEIDPKNGRIVEFGIAASFCNRELIRRRIAMYDHAMNSGLVSARNMLASGQDKTGSVTRESRPQNYSTSSRMDTKLMRYKHPVFHCELAGLE